MKLFGYTDEGLPPERVAPAALAEITLCATPDELRKMAAFLSSCAAEMERMGPVYDHVHLSDRLKEFESSPHFVVASLRSE
jgi:hypothetical protein